MIFLSIFRDRVIEKKSKVSFRKRVIKFVSFPLLQHSKYFQNTTILQIGCASEKCSKLLIFYYSTQKSVFFMDGIEEGVTAVQTSLGNLKIFVRCQFCATAPLRGASCRKLHLICQTNPKYFSPLALKSHKTLHITCLLLPRRGLHRPQWEIFRFF